MKISHGTVVSFEYTLTDAEEEVLDSSEEDGPLTYLHGFGQIVPGLENALEGKKPGDELTVVVPPAEGYGEPSGQPPIRVPRAQLPPEPEPEVGMDLHAESPDGEEQVFWIVEVEKDHVLLSPDHPLAGVELHFDIRIEDVREATSEEIEHGHVHGDDDGHGHDHGHSH